MILPIVKWYVKRKTKLDNKGIISILNKYVGLSELGENKLVFTTIPFFLSDINANSSFYKIICVSGGWAVRIISHNDNETENAFLVTLGHELGHKKKQYNRICNLRNFRFLSWVIETNCDFFGAYKMIDGCRKDFISSIEYKINIKNIKIKDTKIEKPLFHPTWIHRLDYAVNYNFDENLIRRIAVDTGCTNEKLIRDVIDFYDEIILI